MYTTDNINELATHHTGASRLPVLKRIHENIELSLKERAPCAIQDPTCTSSEEAEIFFHIFWTLHVADKPQCDDILSVKCRTEIATLCHSYVVAKDIFNSNRNEKQRNLGDTLYSRNKLNIGLSQGEQHFLLLAMLLIPSFFNSSLFIGVHSSDDIFASFWFKPRHGSSLGIYWVLQKFLYSFLTNLTRATYTMTYQSAKPNPYKMNW